MVPPATYYVDEWLELSATLRAVSIDKLNPGWFQGYIPDDFSVSHNRILYVCASVPGYSANVFGNGPHPLKDDPLAAEFVRSLGGLAGGSGNPLDSVAVTSICKVSLIQGEVSPQLLLVQQQLAVQTLRYELYALQPKLVVFSCGGKFSAVIRETVNAVRGSLADVQTEGQGIEALSFRKRGDVDEPAVLILQPPNAFPKLAQAQWLAKAAMLLR